MPILIIYKMASFAEIYILQFYKKICGGLTNYLDLLGKGNKIIKILIIYKYLKKSL